VNPIALVTDSSACLPPSSRRLGVWTVPILVRVGSEDYQDGVNLDPETLYGSIRRGIPVKSSAPTPLDYLEAIEGAGADHVVVITPAAEFTWMFRSATLASDLASRRVSVVDSRSATAGHCLVVMAAAAAARAGKSGDEVVALAQDAASRVELVGCLETLDFLRSSGRVPALALGMASQLGVRPLFRFRAGVAERVGLPRSLDAALSRMVKAWQEAGGETAERTAVFHAARPDGAEDLRRRLGVDAFTTEFSAAMGIHTGPGVVGVAWLRSQ
jgi:fatty acid kinase fatty acid binding subunit